MSDVELCQRAVSHYVLIINAFECPIMSIMGTLQIPISEYDI